MPKTLQQSAPSADAAWRPERRFVPLRAEHLMDLLCADAPALDVSEQELRRVFLAVRDVIEQEASRFHSELELAYERFNPDRETLTLPHDSAPDRGAFAALHRQLTYLLEKANFERLDNIRIAQVVERASTARIHVRIHPDRVERLELWVRGNGVRLRRRRTLRRPLKGREERTPVFKRLAVVAQLKDQPDVMIKLFKDIPEHDVEALLPHAEAAMTLLDRVKLFGSSAGAAGATIVKLTKVALAFTMLTKILGIVAVGVGVVALRTFFGYKHAKTSRDWRRTQRLYFQNLGNNASALQLLISSVKQEELKEACLVYAFALRAAADQDAAGGVEQAERDIRAAIEAYLRDRLAVDVDFDLPDAVDTMTRLSLWRCAESRRVLPPGEAVERLATHRVEQRSINHHTHAAQAEVGPAPPAATRAMTTA